MLKPPSTSSSTQLQPALKTALAHAWNWPTYGAKIQYAKALDTSPSLLAKETTRIQQIIGTFLLYNGIAVDPTMLVAIGSLAASQANATQATLDAIVHS